MHNGSHAEKSCTGMLGTAELSSRFHTIDLLVRLGTVPLGDCRSKDPETNRDEAVFLRLEERPRV
jgi:hypothetical protein